MEQHAVDTIGMAAQRPDRLAVGRGPKLDEIVVAARGHNLTIGCYRQTTGPPFVRRDRALCFRLAFLGAPPNQSAIAGGRDDRPTFVQETNPEDPAFVTRICDFDVAG